MPEPRYFSMPRGGRWRHRLEKRGSELDAMRAVVLPRPACLNKLAGGNHRRVAENGDQIALTPRLHPQYAEPVLLVVEGDALYQATEDIGRCACAASLPHGGDLILAPHATH